MSLATRCIACGTVFRVVQDQLKVSEGWVRCGRCNEVFNALESLFDLEHEAPPPWPPVPAAAAVAADASRGGSARDETIAPYARRADESADGSLVDRIDAQVFGAQRVVADAPAPRGYAPDRGTQAGSGAQAPVHPLVGANARADAPDDLAEPEASALFAAASAPATAPAAEPPAPPQLTDTAPDFIRHADRLARWQSPRARAALIAGSAFLLLMLAGQVAHQFRDVIAARWPDTRPALVAWCGLAGCSLQAPRHIDEIAVESTSLTRASGPDAFRLAVTLRSRSAIALALPSVDLSLTDVSGQLVARRAITPQDFRAASPLLPPGGEAALQLLLSTGNPRVTGYTVEIFYP
ncbi:hypothetical protein BH11PSE9_BH11PSE9_37980 [soil metagenome]